MIIIFEAHEAGARRYCGYAEAQVLQTGWFIFGGGH